MLSLGDLKSSPGVISAIYNLKSLRVSANQIPVTAPIDFLLSTAKSLDDPSVSISDSMRTSSLFQIAQELDERQWHKESAQVLRTLLTRCSSYIDSAERLVASSKLAVALSYINPEEAEIATRSLPKVFSGYFFSNSNSWTLVGWTHEHWRKTTFHDSLREEKFRRNNQNLFVLMIQQPVQPNQKISEGRD